MDRCTLLDAPGYVTEWIRAHTTLQEAWGVGRDARPMLWLLGRAAGRPGSDGRRRLVRCLCDCIVELAQAPVPSQFWSAFDRHLDVTSRWSRGDAAVGTFEVTAAANRVAKVGAEGVTPAEGECSRALAHAGYVAEGGYGDEHGLDPSYHAPACVAAIVWAAIVGSGATGDAEIEAVADRVFAACADVVRRHYPSAPRLPC